VIACAALGAARAEAIAFTPSTDYAVGTWPVSIAVGDFDRDGVKDIATANNSSEDVSVLLGVGDGTFAPSVAYPAGGKTSSIAVGDFNADANEDLVLANTELSRVSVFTGKGDGTFNPMSDYHTYETPYAVATGDLDGNGHDDVVTANYYDDCVTVYLENGGGFTDHSYTTSFRPRSVAIGDVDGDGDDDLAVVCNGCMDVLLGDGLGGFPDRVVTSQAGVSTDIVCGDFDGDDDDDLAAISEIPGTLCVLLASGNGALATNGVYSVGSLPQAVGTADLNGDGNLDLVAAAGTGYSFWILFGSGDGSFADPASFTLQSGSGYEARDVAAGDFDGDGITDLAFATFGNVVRAMLCRWPQPPSGTMVLDGGAAATKSLAALVSSKVTEALLMRIRNQGGSWGGWMPYSGMAAWALPSGDGTKSVDVQYSNLIGKTTLSSSIVLDTTPPTTTDDAPSGWQRTSTLGVTLTAEDTGSGVESTQYKVDQESMWATGTTVTVTGNGTHTIRYRSTDEAGNAEETDFCTVQLDSTPPVTTASGPVTAWHSFPVTVVFSALDAISGVAKTEWSTDGGATWTSGISVTAFAQGETTISYRSIDQAGNVETAKTCTARVDTQAPSTSGANVTAGKNKKAVFKVKIADPKPCSPDGASVQIRIKNAKGKDVKVLGFANVATNVTVSLSWSKCALAKGNYSYQVYATDAAGNSQKAAGGAKLKVK